MRSSIERVFGADEAERIWAQACTGVGVSATSELPLPRLREICTYIERMPGLTGVVGTSLRIRCDVYGSLEVLG